MKIRRPVLFHQSVLSLGAAVALLTGLWMVHGRSGAAAESEPPRAGEVSALLPRALAERQAGPKDLVLRDPVFWNDLVKTIDRGRVRILLDDKSVVNVGARSEMRIVKHDAKTRESRLVLEFGRIRARVIKAAGPHADFEVRTGTAVIGSVGTEFYVRGDDKESTVIGFEDKARVRNQDPSVKGEEILGPGELTTVVLGQPPTPKRLATPQEMRQAMEETMPGQVARIEPFQNPAGSHPRVVMSAPGLDHLPKLAGSDLPIEIEPGPCATTGYVTADLKLSPETAPGIHEVEFEGPQGPIMAALLVQPQSGAPGPSVGRMIHATKLPAGALHRGVVVAEDMKPMAGARVRIEQGGKATVAETDATGHFQFRAKKPGTVNLSLEGTNRRSSLQVVRKFDLSEAASRFTRPGDFLNVPGVLQSAKFGEQPLAMATTELKKGEGFSTVAVPVDVADGPGELTLEDTSGHEQMRPVFIYRVLGGRIDNPSLISGQKTQGEFVVCFGGSLGEGHKLQAILTARGFIRFIGDGAKGQLMKRTIKVAGQGTARIPFRILALKGAGPGVPFFIDLSLSE